MGDPLVSELVGEFAHERRMIRRSLKYNHELFEDDTAVAPDQEPGLYGEMEEPLGPKERVEAEPLTAAASNPGANDRRGDGSATALRDVRRRAEQEPEGGTASEAGTISAMRVPPTIVRAEVVEGRLDSVTLR